MKRSYGRTLAWPGAIGALACAVAVGVLAGRVNALAVGNSDLLMLLELIPDLLNGGELASWYLTPATFMFPDWPMFAIARLLGHSPVAAMAAFAALQTLVVGYGAYLFASAIDTRRAPAIATVSTAVFAVLVLLERSLVQPLVTPSIHAGTAVWGMVVLGAMLRWLRDRRAGFAALSAVVTFGLVASDQIVAFWTLAPVGIAMVVVAAARLVDRSAALRWSVLHVVVTLAAYPVRDILAPTKADFRIHLAFQPGSGWQELVFTLRKVSTGQHRVVTTVIILVAVLALCLWRGRSLLGSRFDPGVRIAVAVFVPAMVLLTVATQLAVVRPTRPELRYMLPFLLVPISLAPSLALASSRGAGGPGRWDAVPRTVALVSLVAVAVPTLSNVTQIDAGHVPVPLECVEDALGADSTRGIADYWVARPFQVYSDGRLVMTEVKGDLDLRLVNLNRREATGIYDFVVLRNARREDLQYLSATLGTTPLRTARCAEYTVLDFGSGGIDLRDRHT